MVNKDIDEFQRIISFYSKIVVLHELGKRMFNHLNRNEMLTKNESKKKKRNYVRYSNQQ